MHIIGVEGISFSGKTLLVKAIKNNLRNVGIIEEYGVYAGGAKNFPFPASFNRKEVLQLLNFFLKLELQRYKDLISLQREKSYKTLLIDRTVLSLMAFQYAIRFITKIDTYKEALKMIRRKRTCIPDHIIYLAISPQTARERFMVYKGQPDDLFVDSFFNSKLIEFYQQYAPSLFDIPIITINAEKSSQNVFQDALELISRI